MVRRIFVKPFYPDRSFLMNIDPDYVIEYVSRKMSIPIDKIKGKRRKREYVEARQICVSLLTDVCSLKSEQVALAVGYGERTTVTHCLKQVENLAHLRNLKVVFTSELIGT